MSCAFPFSAAFSSHCSLCILCCLSLVMPGLITFAVFVLLWCSLCLEYPPGTDSREHFFFLPSSVKIISSTTLIRWVDTEKCKKQPFPTQCGFLYWLQRQWIWSLDILFLFLFSFLCPFFLSLLLFSFADWYFRHFCIQIVCRVSWGPPLHPFNTQILLLISGKSAC